MKDHSSSTQLCPFCGKAFKRLKSHLPYCKLADNKRELLSTDHMNKDISNSQLAVKNMNEKETSIQCSKVKEKKKTDNTERIGRPKKQLQKDKSASSSLITQPKMAKPLSWNMETCLTQQKNIINIREQQCLKKNVKNINVGNPNDTGKLALTEDISSNHSCKKDLNTDLSDKTLPGTNQVVTLLKEQAQAPIPVRVSFAPVLQDVLASPDTERNLSVTVETLSESNSLQNLNVTCPNILSNTLTKTDVKYSKCSEKIKHSAQGGIGNHDIALHDQLKNSPNGQHNEKMSLIFQQNSKSSFHCTKSAQVSIIGLSSTIVQKSLDTQFSSDISFASHLQDMHETSLGNVKALETIGKSMDICPEFLSTCKTDSVADMKADNDSLGLQWIPHLYTNYVRQCIAPGRQDKFSLNQSKTTPPPELKPDNQLVSRGLLDVKIGDLPSWLAGHKFSAKMFPGLVQNAWRTYYNKYINVRKGGVASVTMLLAGYCILSYAWNFNHIKQDRWRKYH